MDLDTVADELYGLSLEDFIPTRTAREREAKAANDKTLATEIHRLPKPNAVAWLVNQLVRRRTNEIQTLLALGSEMREATTTFSGDRLRDLSRQQREVVRGLVQQAERLAVAAGQQISTTTANSLEETLRAAMADPSAADIVASGRLTAGLHSTGFTTSDSAATQQPLTTAKVPTATKPRSRTKDRQGAERERAEAKLAHAQSVAGEAVQARQVARNRLQLAEQSVADAADRVDRLRSELREAMDARSKAETDRRRAQSALDRADRGAEDAQRRLADAVAPQKRSAR